MKNLKRYQTTPWDDKILPVDVVPGTERGYSDLHMTWEDAHSYLVKRARATVSNMELALEEAKKRVERVEEMKP